MADPILQKAFGIGHRRRIVTPVFTGAFGGTPDSTDVRSAFSGENFSASRLWQLGTRSAISFMEWRKNFVLIASAHELCCLPLSAATIADLLPGGRRGRRACG